VGDIDFSKKVINIRAEVSKNQRACTIGIHEQLYNVLINLHLEEYHPRHFVFSHNLLPGLSQLHPNRIHDAWRDFRLEHGITKTLYKLKHTGAGMSVEAGANIRDLQLQLRHSSLEMTQIYLDKFKQVVSSESLKSFASFGDDS
jgi:integrase